MIMMIDCCDDWRLAYHYNIVVELWRVGEEGAGSDVSLLFCYP